MEFKPYEYQIYAINRIIKQPFVGLFLDMGMGKTICTLTAISELLKSNRVKKILVIAPLRVAGSTWSEEAKKFNHTRHLNIVKVLGTKKDREAAIRQEAHIYVINRENVPWLVEQYYNNCHLIWLL